MTNKRKIVIAIAAALIALSIGCIYLTRENEISGDQLKTLVQQSDRKIYSSWYLYYEDQRKYCLRFSRPILPIRYCVPKTDLDIRNSEGSRSSEIGYIGMGDFVLKGNRRPGLPEEVF